MHRRDHSKTGATANAEMMRCAMPVCPVSCPLGGFRLWLGSRMPDKTGE